MKKFLVAAWIGIVSGCATAPSPAPLTPIVSNVVEDGCFSVFPLDGQLAIVTSYGRDGQLTVYNPANGLFISRSLHRRVVCSQVNIARDMALWARFEPEIALYLIDHPFARKALANAKANPDAIKEVINWNAPTFRRLDPFKPFIIMRDLEKTIRITNEASPEKVLTTYSSENVQAIVAALEQRKAARSQQAAVEAEAYYRAKKVAMERWNNRAKAKYAVGDRVCTYEGNLFGNIEAITAERFKVYVVGRSVESNGFFFSPENDPFTPERIEAPRWFDKDEVAHCEFKPRFR